MGREGGVDFCFEARRFLEFALLEHRRLPMRMHTKILGARSIDGRCL